ncbi:DUF4129 domain-containing protein [Jatrophihabitans endophyticus]|uniref:DUF4129 domain-containing protein n=1 Tax=Jatrophihabitans endophyticus TaxID=1206085 RepID=UPI001160FEBA|nr:DUF4129 domain-containing protein [Jatrophihabitans endophyticus]
MRAFAAARMSGLPVGGDAARDAARRELERPEYHRDDRGLVQRALHWLGERLGALFGGGTGNHAILLLLALVAAVALVLVIRAGVPARRRARRGDPPDAIDLLAAADSRDHRRAALQCEREGRRADALREWLRAAVATIEERGVLPPRPGRTGAATAREAGPALPVAAAALTAAMTAFEQVWFGGRPATDDDVSRARGAADAVGSARIVTHDVPAGFAAPW